MPLCQCLVFISASINCLGTCSISSNQWPASIQYLWNLHPIEQAHGSWFCCAMVCLGHDVDCGEFILLIIYIHQGFLEIIALYTLIARFMGQHGAHLGPTGPRWAPCWPHKLCYLSRYHRVIETTLVDISKMKQCQNSTHQQPWCAYILGRTLQIKLNRNMTRVGIKSS